MEEAVTINAPSMGCQMGIPGGTVRRIVINIGVTGGKSDITVASVDVGSRTIFIQTNIGDIAIIITGVIKLCDSFISETAAPMAINMEPYMNTANT